VSATPGLLSRPRVSGRALILGALLGLILLARLAPLRVIQEEPEKALWADSFTYLEVASLWLDGHGVTGTLASNADLERPPGYPVFLASVFAVAGENLPLVVFFQLIMGAGVCGLLYLMGRLISPGVGYGAALIYALMPDVVLWAMAILSDTLFTLLVTASLACLLWALRGRRILLFLLSGLLLGVAALTRPIGLAILPIWAIFLLVRAARGPDGRRAILLRSLLFVGAALLPIVLWSYRNFVIHGIFTVSPINSAKLGRYDAPYTLAQAEGISLEEARARIPTSSPMAPGDRARFLRILLAHPLEYVVVHMRGTWYLLSEVAQPNQALLVGERFRTPGFLTALREGDPAQALAGLLSQLQDDRLRWFVILTWPSLAFLLALYLLSLVGGAHLVRHMGESRWIGVFMITTAAVFMLVPGPVGNGRFRVPAEPMLAFLASAGIAAIRRWIASRRHGRGRT